VAYGEHLHVHTIAAFRQGEAGVAATVSWESLRDLAGFRAEQGCAISVYLDLDPSDTPTPADADSRVNSLLDAAEKRAHASRPELTHEQREGVRADFTRIRRFFEDEFTRDGAHGLAIFASGLDNFWRTLPLSESVADGVRVGRELYLAPLVPLVGRGEGALVVAVGSERGDIYRLRAGRLEQIADQFDDQPYRRHDQGGWSQANYQRHVERHVLEHLRAVADLLDNQIRRLDKPRTVIVASEEIRAEFDDLLSHEVKSAVIGWTQAEAHATPAELLKEARPVLEDWRSNQEKEAVERWRSEAGRNGRAAAGWPQTLEAASDARVDQLLFQDGAGRIAWQCPACGRVGADGGSCPLDGTRMDEREDGLDLAVHQTLAHGGTVLALVHHRDLEPVEGIGALLRF
jgi:peptide chain release factor subunit 1